MRISTVVVAACLLVGGANAKGMRQAMQMEDASSSPLANALSNGKLSGSLYGAYNSFNEYAIPGVPFSDSESFAVGAELKYVSNPYHGFQIGLTAQGSSTAGLEPDTTDGRMSISGVAFSEAYLRYNFDKKTYLKLGRQYWNGPFFNTVIGFPMKNYYEAFFVKSRAFPNTVITAGAVTKMMERTAVQDDEYIRDFDDPMYNIQIGNKSIKGLTINAQAIYMDGANEAFNKLRPVNIHEQNFLYTYIGAKYKLPFAPVSVRAEHFNLAYDTLADGDRYRFGATVNLPYVALSLDHGKTSDEQDILGSKEIMLFNHASFKGMETWIAKADIDVGKLFGIPEIRRFELAHGTFESDTHNGGLDAQESTIDVVIRCSGELKNLFLRPRFANIHYDKSNGVDVDDTKQEFRFIATYKF